MVLIDAILIWNKKKVKYETLIIIEIYYLIIWMKTDYYENLDLF